MTFKTQESEDRDFRVSLELLQHHVSHILLVKANYTPIKIQGREKDLPFEGKKGSTYCQECEHNEVLFAGAAIITTFLLPLFCSLDMLFSNSINFSRVFYNPVDWKLVNYYGGSGGLVAKSCSTLVIPWTAAHQAPLSMEFPKPEC